MLRVHNMKYTRARAHVLHGKYSFFYGNTHKTNVPNKYIKQSHLIHLSILQFLRSRFAGMFALVS